MTEPRRVPKKGDNVLVRSSVGTWHEGVVTSIWGPGDGSCPEPEAVSLAVNDTVVRLIAHKDFAPAFASSYWIWPIKKRDWAATSGLAPWTEIGPIEDFAPPALSSVVEGVASSAPPKPRRVKWRTEGETSAATTARSVACDGGGSSVTLSNRPQNYSSSALLSAMVIASRVWGDRAPNDAAILRAHRLIDRLATVVALKRRVWLNPHVPPSIDEVVFEWWRGCRKLTIDVGSETTEFTKVWGTNVETEMESGLIGDRLDELQELWAWLTTQ